MLHICREMKFPPQDIKVTPRGKEVFLLILDGLNINQIAHHLGISRSGVRHHREKMIQENGCESMIELIAKYYGTYAKQYQETPYGD